ncbi:hypothetical protein F443_17240 [Phytophthora nicotianae P1569]|uniref:Uncharacterized protein n=1 Tax=Phytophthora nicotianae P1569 TaxID=1317065 RepID=V9EBZ6_PHYNI|nr:hypothetical protein F443_17240 [Phytophthora nicotianae P1569]
MSPSLQGNAMRASIRVDPNWPELTRVEAQILFPPVLLGVTVYKSMDTQQALPVRKFGSK